ncbi:MAG: glycosyltransferase [Flavobacteriales bacterium]|nr:glycosyltransferase [Flavobacteriales bacterium]
MNAAPPWKPGDPLVSVVTVTYQHAAFIEECVKSVLAQRTDFPFELLIGEDQSTDGTREICQRLADAHPERIRLFLRDRKDVIHILGRPTGRANVIGLYHEARGKYIAVCPGDDHWTDPGKLQRQVDLMEARQELSACFTNAWEERAGERNDYLRGWLKGQVPTGDLGPGDVLLRNYVPSQTFLFRRDLLLPLPKEFWTAPISDHLLVLHLASQGPIGYLDGHTAVRRAHPGGLISMKGALHKIEVNVATMEALRTMLGAPHAERLMTHRRQLLEEGLQLALDTGEREHARRFWDRLRTDPGSSIGLRRRLRMKVLLDHPGLAKAIHRLRTGTFGGR